MTSVLGASGQSGDPDASTNTLQQIRQIGDQVTALGASNPALAQVVQQIKMLLRQAIVQTANAASVQTPSSMATPGV